MKRLRIGHIAPLFLPTPPPRYGGTERIVCSLSEAQVMRGHEVYVFCTANSKVRAEVVPIIAKGLWEERHPPKDSTAFYAYQMSRVSQFLKDHPVDILHDHMGPMSLALYGNVDATIVHTLHGSLKEEPERIWPYQQLDAKLVSLSHAQRTAAPRLNYVATIYNGVDTDVFHRGRSDDEKRGLLFAGSLMRHKGICEAIDVATSVGSHLNVVGRIPTPDQREDFRYFKENVEPRLALPHIHYLGEVRHVALAKLYRQAKVFLFPSMWQEPFGLVMAEAMACGTPVVGYAMGAVREVISDGVTGFVVHVSKDDRQVNFAVKEIGVEGLCAATRRILSMDRIEYARMRKNCRARVEENFTIARMVEGYERVYSLLRQ